MRYNTIVNKSTGNPSFVYAFYTPFTLAVVCVRVCAYVQPELTLFEMSMIQIRRCRVINEETYFQIL